MCHHTECHYISNKADTILYHTLNQHSGAEKFKLRCNIFDDKIEHFAYQTLHCDVTIEELRTRNKNGYKCYVHMKSKKISFKRLSTASKESIASADKGTQTCNKCHIPSLTECY